MARQGRQPTQQSKPNAAKSRPAAKAKGKAKDKGKATTSSAPPLDIYSYSSSVKKPRGDVDPESRPSANRASKGKGRQRDEDDESDEDLSDEEEFGGDGVVEFTGVKPEGLYMGGDEDDEEGGRINSEDDEDIDSDEAFEDEDDLPLKPKGKGGKVRSASDYEGAGANSYCRRTRL